MKKKLTIFIIILFFVIFVTVLVIYLNFNNKSNISKNPTLSIMLETDENSGLYEASSSNKWPTENYTFNESKSYCNGGSTLVWDSQTNSISLTASNGENCFVYFDKEPVIVYLYDYIKRKVYTSDGVNGLYYHDGTGSYTNADEEAGDKSYRYSGANPNNYICFGSNANPCPDEYLYRIIGIFDENNDNLYQTKIIKNTIADSSMLGTNTRDYTDDILYTWNYNTSVSRYGSNNWTTSELNKINLNINYINYLGSDWSKLIEVTNWHLGAFTSASKAKNLFNYERNNSGYGSNPTVYDYKIGLLYPSDYGYAASPSNWKTSLDEYSNVTGNNWLYTELESWTAEWTISSSSTNAYTVWRISYGDLSTRTANYSFSVRPTFYLKYTVKIAGGDGTISNPYRVSE